MRRSELQQRLHRKIAAFAAMESSEVVLKVVLVGDCSVGKSRLARRFCGGTSEDTQATVGIEFATRVNPSAINGFLC